MFSESDKNHSILDFWPTPNTKSPEVPSKPVSGKSHDDELASHAEPPSTESPSEAISAPTPTSEATSAQPQDSSTSDETSPKAEISRDQAMNPFQESGDSCSADDDDERVVFTPPEVEEHEDNLKSKLQTPAKLHSPEIDVKKPGADEKKAVAHSPEIDAKKPGADEKKAECSSTPDKAQSDAPTASPRDSHAPAKSTPKSPVAQTAPAPQSPTSQEKLKSADLPTLSNPVLDITEEEDVHESAPDLSDIPVLPKSEFERTLIFERNEDRWEDAKSYKLPEPGDIVGNYRVLSMLGKGGFGAVYCAKNLTLGREEALKLILPSAKSECGDIDKRFEREVDIVSRLEHPNIVRLYSSGTLEHNILWMTMELVRGVCLDKRLQDSGPMKFPKAKNIMLQLLSGLMEAHRRQIIHRDLKPANVMLAKKEGYADQVIILDFGLSKALGASEDATVQELTCVDSRRIYGTPQYMAPEQLNAGKLGPWTDVYAAGLIFFELLVGEAAVVGDSLFEVAFKQSYEPIDYPPFLRDTVVQTLIDRACAKNPADRFRNAGEFFDALQCVEDLSDPPSVLTARHASSLDNLGLLRQTRDPESGEKTRISLPAVPQESVPIQHHEHTGMSHRTSNIRLLLQFVGSACALAFIALLILWFLGIVKISF